MNKTILVFVAGAVTGAAATWFYTKKKYELLAQEEIDSVKETLTARLKEYTNMEVDPLSSDEPEITEEDKPECYEPEITEEDKMEYKEVLGNVNYAACSAEPKKESKKQKKKTKKTNEKVEEVVSVTDENKPYVIAPEEFGDDDEFGRETLYYFADGHLTDDQDELIDDIEGLVSYHALTTFGDYEEDSVYVRNERLKCDYEILLDVRRYEDVMNEGR